MSGPPFIMTPEALAEISPVYGYLNEIGWSPLFSFRPDDLRDRARLKTRKKLRARASTWDRSRHVILFERIEQREWRWGHLATLPVEAAECMLCAGEA